MNIESTIDAFLDGETVAPAALDAALAAVEGRAYLMDVLALRQLLSDQPAAAAPVRRGGALLSYARAAGVVLALVGLGYAAGARTAPREPLVVPTSSALSVAPPEPTRVIELQPGVNWHESKGGD
jgi:hypothetical protein